MKYHCAYRRFDLWTDRERLARIVDVSTLSAARLEPVSFDTRGSAAVDLTFERDGNFAIVPALLINDVMLDGPTSSAFLWPASSFVALNPSVAAAIEERLLPWLLSMIVGRGMTRESVRIYREGRGSDAFARAADYGFLGAASYARVSLAMAPYVLAVPNARGRRCAVSDVPAGASGAALLSRNASEVAVDFDSTEAADFARQWFWPTLADVGGGTYDLSISRAGGISHDAPRQFVIGGKADVVVPIVEPVPLEITTVFDTGDGEAVESVSVLVPEPGLRAPFGASTSMPHGGSSGRILFALREDGMRVGDSDSDEARALADALRAEGFTVDVVAVTPDLEPQGYDLVHIFSVRAAVQFDPLTEVVRRSGVPLVVTANLPDAMAQGYWGSEVTNTVERMTVDAATMDDRLELIVLRKLNGDEVARGKEPYPGYLEVLARVLSRCDGAIVHSAEEGRLLLGRGFAGDLAELAPVVVTDVPTQAVAAMAGDGDFVFAHAPIAARTNLLALARAAEAAGLPLVIAGAVEDANYLAGLRRWNTEAVTLLTSASDAQIASLYRRARVYADVGWIPGGLARPLRALISGCRVVLASDNSGCGVWGDIVRSADPASAPAISVALTAAWASAADPAATARQAAGVAAACDTARTLSATVNLYAQAAGRRANP